VAVVPYSHAGVFEPAQASTAQSCAHGRMLCEVCSLSRSLLDLSAGPAGGKALALNGGGVRARDRTQG
jgi:hypothetical protein